MNDAYFLSIMARQRQADFEREARIRDLRMSEGANRPGIWAGVCSLLGDLLIRAGQAIKSKTGPACNQELHGGPKPCKVRA